MWCCGGCQRRGQWHARLCEGSLRQLGRPEAAAAAAEYRRTAERSGNAAFMVAARIYASLPMPSDSSGPRTGVAPAASSADDGLPLGWGALRGLAGAFWWDTLRPDGPAKEDEHETQGGWGASYGAAFRAEMIAQTVRTQPIPHHNSISRMFLTLACGCRRTSLRCSAPL